MRSVRGTLAVALAGCALGLGDAWAFKIVSFNGTFTRWNRTELHYVVDKRGSDDFHDGCDSAGPCTSVHSAIRKSFETWSAANGVNIDFVADTPQTLPQPGYDGKNSIVWVESQWQQLPFSPPAGALAVTVTTYKTSNNEIVDSDIHFNGENFHWGIIDSEEEQASNVVDIQNIATHEIGHFIGLDHSSENIFEPENKLYLATMFFASGPGETFRRDLTDDDENGLKQLYPVHEAGLPEIARVEPETVDASYMTAATLTIRGGPFASNVAALLAIPGDHGDVYGRVLTVSRDELTVSFDLYGMPSGTYDVVVANAYDRMDRLTGGFTVTGSNSEYGWEDGSFSTGGGGCAASPGSGLVAILLPLLLIGLARLQLSRKAASSSSPSRRTE